MCLHVSAFFCPSPPPPQALCLLPAAQSEARALPDSRRVCEKRSSDPLRQWRTHTRCIRWVRTPCENSNFWVCEVLKYLSLRPLLSRGVDVNSEVPERSMKKVWNAAPAGLPTPLHVIRPKLMRCNFFQSQFSGVKLN